MSELDFSGKIAKKFNPAEDILKDRQSDACNIYLFDRECISWVTYHTIRYLKFWCHQ